MTRMGTWARTLRILVAILALVAIGGGAAPASASHCTSWAELLAYTIRPRPTQPWAAAHIAQCSPEV